ncbi:MAG TPA: TetR/AcrR family transcriptional regulator [Burkholderiaceae bacterium]|nr:TetR/AcrR family transcriptional regulator [Burkholderiaceae bacterium]
MAYRQTPAVQARLEDTRRRILKAARSLISEGGWQQAQVASVAAVAGIATGTVYRYFASKAELFAEVLSLVSQREVDVIKAISSSDGSAQARLHAAVATFVKRALRNPRLAYALIAEPCDPEIDAARLTYRAALSEAIRQIITHGQDNGEFHPDIQPDIAASVIVGGFMEGLIGPLSPLNHQQPHAAHHPHSEIEQIATQACRSVSIQAA